MSVLATFRFLAVCSQMFRCPVTFIVECAAMSRLCVLVVLTLVSVHPEPCETLATMLLTFPTRVIAFCQVPHVICAWKLYPCARMLMVAVLISAVVSHTQHQAVGSAVPLAVEVVSVYRVMNLNLIQRKGTFFWHSITTVATFTAPLQTAGL